MARHTKVFLLAGIAGLGVVSAALALIPTLTEQPVLNGPRNEALPAIARASSADVLVWSQSRAGHRDQYDAYLRRGSGSKLKLNLRGLGFAGDVNPPWVSYQQIEGNKSDIKLYRLDKRKRVPAPRGLNTSQWERRPRMSGNWILFARDRMSTPTTRLILFNRKTLAQRVLATGRYDGDNALSPGQINGNWAVWYKCSPVCDGFLYNISTRVKTKLPKPSGPDPIFVWTLGVTKTGIVYAGQGPEGCGNSPTLVRYGRPGDLATGTVIHMFPAGKDFNGTYVRSKADGSVDIYYSRINCGSPETTDIFRANDPPPP